MAVMVVVMAVMVMVIVVRRVDCLPFWGFGLFAR